MNKNQPAVEPPVDNKQLEEIETNQQKPEADKNLNSAIDQPKTLKEAAKDLENKAKDDVKDDVRRAQLTMRASERDRVEEERELQKQKKEDEKKEASATAPKAKGRPRKGGDEPPAKRTRVKKNPPDAPKEETKEETKDGNDKSEEPKDVKPKKRKTAAQADVAEEPEVKKPKAAAKRTPKSKIEEEPKVDKTVVKECLNLMKRYQGAPYDKTQDILHKIYNKKNVLSVYWSRPAAGVKVIDDGVEGQKFYFSHCYPTVAVHIYLGNRMCSKFIDSGSPQGWFDTAEALSFYQMLLVSASEATETFLKKD